MLNVFKKIISIKIAVAFICLASVSAYASVVKSVSVDGNQRIQNATVESYVAFAQDQEFTPMLQNKVIKELYDTGIFADIAVSFDPLNGNLIVKVVENPTINQVVFNGNPSIKDKKLAEVTSVKSRGIYSPSAIKKDVDIIKDAYRQSGYFLVIVEPQIIQRPQNRVDVIYKITEGQKTKIKKIRFLGNHGFSDYELKGVVSSKEAAWWRFGSSQNYSSERVATDKELLKRFYEDNGFANVVVTSGNAELAPAQDGFYITYTIVEGKKYNFGDITIILDAYQPGLDANELKSVLTIKKGQRFSGVKIENNVENLIKALGSKGFAFLDVVPKTKRDEASKTVELVYHIQPGPRVYINKINITGNVRTKDKVIRREMRIAEGDPFSADRLKLSKEKLTYLGYFESVDMSPRQTKYPDRMDLNIKVKEQSTSELNFGVGYSTSDGPLFNASVSENNLFGNGQTLNLSTLVSGSERNVNIGFTEPYFLNTNISAGFNAYIEKYDYTDQSSYSLDTKGASVTFGIPLSDNFTNSVTVGYRDSSVIDVSDDASQFIKEDEGSYNGAFAKYVIAYDTRDNRLDPTAGYRLSLDTEISTFGSLNYAKFIAGASFHHEVMDDIVASIGFKGGAIIDMSKTGEHIPTFKLFQMGAGTLRGFATSGIGPRDAITQDSLGGMYMGAASAEVAFPFPGLADAGVKGVLFVDSGIVTGFREDSAAVIDSKSLRMSVGAGIKWKTPLGPLRFDFGFPILKSDEDKKQVFMFSIGTTF